MDRPKTIDEYLSTVPEDKRRALQKLREQIRAAAPEATEAISYSMPAFKFKGNLVSFAAFKDHCSLFPMSVEAIEAFGDELKDYRTSKGTLRFTPDKPLPAALVKKLVKARMRENEAKSSRKH
jgi:uncharacterized protein YdhG (YjbR/CyaY superfamily)